MTTDQSIVWESFSATLEPGLMIPEKTKPKMIKSPRMIIPWVIQWWPVALAMAFLIDGFSSLKITRNALRMLIKPAERTNPIVVLSSVAFVMALLPHASHKYPSADDRPCAFHGKTNKNNH